MHEWIDLFVKHGDFLAHKIDVSLWLIGVNDDIWILEKTLVVFIVINLLLHMSGRISKNLHWLLKWLPRRTFLVILPFHRLALSRFTESPVTLLCISTIDRSEISVWLSVVDCNVRLFHQLSCVILVLKVQPLLWCTTDCLSACWTVRFVVLLHISFIFSWNYGK